MRRRRALRAAAAVLVALGIEIGGVATACNPAPIVHDSGPILHDAVRDGGNAGKVIGGTAGGIGGGVVVGCGVSGHCTPG